MSGVEGADVALLFLFEDLGDGEEDACLFDIAELVVDGGAEHAHGGRQAHIGVDERRDVDAVGTDGFVEYLVIVEIVGTGEYIAHRLQVGFGVERVYGAHESVGIAEVLVHEVEDHVAALLVVAGIHGDLAEEIFDFGMHDGESAETVP